VHSLIKPRALASCVTQFRSVSRLLLMDAPSCLVSLPAAPVALGSNRSDPVNRD